MDAQIPLYYEPVIQPLNADRGVVVVKQFTDTRPNPSIVGEVRNLKMERTADMVVGAKDAATWVTEAVSEELERIGYRSADLAAVDIPVVEGEIVEFFISIGGDFVLLSRLRVKLVVWQGAKVVLEKSYLGKGIEVAKWGLAKEGATASKIALQNLLKRAIPQISEAIK